MSLNSVIPTVSSTQENKLLIVSRDEVITAGSDAQNTPDNSDSPVREKNIFQKDNNIVIRRYLRIKQRRFNNYAIIVITELTEIHLLIKMLSPATSKIAGFQRCY